MRISDWSSDVCSSDLLECYRDHVPRRYLLHLSRGSELPTPMIAPTSETNERRLSTTMSDRGEFAIGPGAAKRMRACAWPSIRPPTANLTAMGEGAWERRPFIVSADDRATGASDRSSRTRARSEAHTSELQSLMRTSYAVFCLNKKKKQ